MKKIFFLFSLLLCAALPGKGQDLISNTQNGLTVRPAIQEPNAVAQLIEDRKNQKAEFRPVQFLNYDPADQTGAYLNVVRDAVYLQLNRGRLQRFWSNPAKDVTLEIPVGNGRYIELEMTQVNIVSKDFKVTTSSGKEEFTAPTGFFYHGVVKGDPGSLAALSVFGDEIRVLMSDREGNYVLGALGPADEKTGNYILYNDRKLEAKNPFECHVPDNALYDRMKRLPETKASPAADGDCVKTYVECDQAMYLSFGSNTGSVVNYVLGLYNEVEIMYRAEQINIEVSQIFIWTTPDPYVAATGTDDALELFGENLQDNYTGRLAHLLSTRSLGGGLAWIDVLCSSYYTFMADFDDDGMDELHHAGPYAVSAIDPTFANVPTYSWSVMVVTHEMGHNFGSPHTHACAWNGDNTQIDDCGNSAAGGDGVFDDDDDGVEDNGCFNPFAMPPQTRIIPAGGGTVMSYCHQNAVGINLALGFGAQPGDLIRGRVAGAVCLAAECSCDEFTDRTVNGTPIPSAVYTAGNSITSSGDADAPANNVVVFRAGNLITLMPGFEATDLFFAEVSSTLCDNGGSSVISLPENIAIMEHSGVRDGGLSLAVFPNPASTEIQVAYSLPAEGMASVRVFNQYGQLIKTLESNMLHPKGEHQLTAPLQHWPSGMYYVVLTSAGDQAVRPFAVNRF